MQSGSAESRDEPETGVEFVAFNGEDYYAASGEVAYLASADIRDVSLVFNIDGVGAARRAALASFNLGDAGARRLKTLLPEHSALVETGLWPEGDHMLFAAAGVPGMTFTSEGIHSLLGSLIHTPADRAERVRVPVLAAVVAFIASFLGEGGGRE